MVTNLLEPGTDATESYFVVSVVHPHTGDPIQCDAKRYGRFTVIQLPPSFLDAPDEPDPATIPLPSSASDAYRDHSDDYSTPKLKLFPLFTPRSLQKNPAPRNKKLSFKKKIQAKTDRTRRNSTSNLNLKKQVCIQAYFSQHADEPITTELQPNPSV